MASHRSLGTGKELGEILTTFGRVWHLLEYNERRSILAAAGLMLVTGFLTNLPAVILGRLVDELTGANKIEFGAVLPFLALIVSIIITREALTIWRKYLVENVTTQTDKKQTVRAVQHLLKTDIASLGGEQIGSLHGRVFRSIEGLVRIIKLGFLDFFPVFFSALAALVIAFTQEPTIATLMLLVMPAGLWIVVWQVSSQKGIRIALLRGKERVDGAVVEMLGGIESVRALHTENDEVAKVEHVAEEMRQKEIRHHIAMAFFDSGKYLNEGFFYLLVISFSLLLAAQGVITKGDILVYSILFLSITGPLREIHRILDQAHESSIRVNDLYAMLNHPFDESFDASPDGARKDAERILEVRNLTFDYGKSGVLRGIDLTMTRGEKIGIVGASGCGKSTLVKILLRLVHGYGGSVHIFGKDLRTLTREEIADRIAYLPQKTYVFTGTVRENVAYGCRRASISDGDIAQALKAAHVYDEVQDALGGLEGRISENGNNLSGGQKQRLAIARLMLRSPDLLIFDEATAALDNTNEIGVQKSIEHAFKDKAILTIAHRLSTLRNADRIVVLDKGRIAQEGTYEELSNRDGLFKDFLQHKAGDVTPADM